MRPERHDKRGWAPHRAALFAPQHLHDPTLIDEATTTVTRYLPDA